MLPPLQCVSTASGSELNAQGAKESSPHPARNSTPTTATVTAAAVGGKRSHRPRDSLDGTTLLAHRGTTQLEGGTTSCQDSAAARWQTRQTSSSSTSSDSSGGGPPEPSNAREAQPGSRAQGRGLLRTLTTSPREAQMRCTTQMARGSATRASVMTVASLKNTSNLPEAGRKSSTSIVAPGPMPRCLSWDPLPALNVLQQSRNTTTTTTADAKAAVRPVPQAGLSHEQQKRQHPLQHRHDGFDERRWGSNRINTTGVSPPSLYSAQTVDEPFSGSSRAPNDSGMPSDTANDSLSCLDFVTYGMQELFSPTKAARPPSPMPSFHQIVTGSYHVPGLEAILRGHNNSISGGGVNAPRHSHAPLSAGPCMAERIASLQSMPPNEELLREPMKEKRAVSDQYPLARPRTRGTPNSAIRGRRFPLPIERLPRDPREEADRSSRALGGPSAPSLNHAMGSARSCKGKLGKAGSPAATSWKASGVISVASIPSVPGFSFGTNSMTLATTALTYSTASLAKTFDGAQYLNDYILLNEIGCGATGRVVLAFSTAMNKSVAIKIMQKPKEKKYRLRRQASLTPTPSPDASVSYISYLTGAERSWSPAMAEAYEAPRSTRSDTLTPQGKALTVPLTTAERRTRNLKREIEVMKRLHHPNIVQLYEVINDPKANSLFLILQYVDQGALAVLDSSGRIPAPFGPSELLPIATQVSDGLVYLHEQHIVHRDIKPENILVSRDGHAFLADFGVAELLHAEDDLPTVATLTYQGTPLFMAPEVYGADDDDDGGSSGTDGQQNDGDKYAAKGTDRSGPQHRSESGSDGIRDVRASRVIDPYAMDVWALGVTLYTLLVGQVPFLSMRQICETMQRGVVIPTSLPASWQNVLRRTLEPRHALRASATELSQMLHAMTVEAAAAPNRRRKSSRTACTDRKHRNRSLSHSSHSRPKRGSPCAGSEANVEGEETVNLTSGSSSSGYSNSSSYTSSCSGDESSQSSSSSLSVGSESHSNHGHDATSRVRELDLTSSALHILCPKSSAPEHS